MELNPECYKVPHFKNLATLLSRLESGCEVTLRLKRYGGIKRGAKEIPYHITVIGPKQKVIDGIHAHWKVPVHSPDPNLGRHTLVIWHEDDPPVREGIPKGKDIGVYVCFEPAV